MTKKKDSFIFFYEWEEIFVELTTEQQCELLAGILDYEIRGITYSGKDGAVRIAMKSIQRSLDRSRAKYEQTCERNRRNGARRWESMPQNATGKSGTNFGAKNATGKSGTNFDAKNADRDRERDRDPDRDRERDPDPDRDWAPPSFEEVDGYAATYALCVDVNEFCAYYEERSWQTRSGRPIDWKKKLREWNERAAYCGSNEPPE